uniref:Structural protein n=1 Tax=Parvoviridae sp. TaxID=1940570 RepID=A0A7D3QIV9_9VIRU|nr:MAG: structural protein [Parvoviridae sp.]
MTKPRIEFDEFGAVPAPQNDYINLESARRARAMRSGTKKADLKAKDTSGKSNRTPEQRLSRKKFFMAQAKKAQAAGKSIADYLSGNNPTPAPSTRPGAAYGKHTLSDSDPDEGPAPKQRPTRSFSDHESDSEMAAAAEHVDPQNDPIDSELSAEQAREGIADGAGGGGGGGGVGESTGNWDCETHFTGNKITTVASRHCICVPRNNHAYKAIFNNNSTNTATAANNSQWLGMSTPWNYLDFNQMDIFFSPQELQHLVNNASRWRPVRFTVEIFNLQIIQKVASAQAGQVTYVNDLTSTLQVFADTHKRYPILSYPNQSTVMSPFPSDIYRCPQYAYLTDQTWSQTGTGTGTWTDRLTNFSKFYVLDQHASAMLRTGNNWATRFSFPSSMGWFDNTRLNIPIHRMMNPLYDTYQPNTVGGDAKLGTFDTWRQPFMPGPYVQQPASNNTLPRGAPSVLMQTSSFIQAVPGPPTAAGANSNHATKYYALNQTTGIAPDSVNQEITAGNVTLYNETTNANKNTNPGGNWTAPAADNTGTAQAPAVPWAGVIPGMVWDKRPLHSRMCIWQRVPNTESGFEPGSELGGIPTRDAPGHIFLRLTPKPVDAATATYIDEFATFTVKITMDWDVEWHSDYAWNPKNLFSWSTADAVAGNYWVDSSSIYRQNHVIYGKQLVRGN